MAGDLELKVRIGAELKELRAALSGVQGDIRNLGDSIKKSAGNGSQGFNGMESTLKAIKTQVIGLVAGFAGLQGIKALARMSDDAASLNARLRIATKTQEEFNTAQAATFDIAQRTRTGLAETVGLYAKLALATKDTEAAQSQLLAITETVNKAAQVGGGEFAANQAAVEQLGQALASGLLAGDELKSIRENAPRLAQAIADGIGVNAGALRKMGEEGKLTTDVVMNALLSQSQAVDAEFKKLPVTFAGAFTQLSNSVTQSVGDFDRATGAFGSLAQLISDFATGLSSTDFLGPLIESFVSFRDTASITLQEVDILVGALGMGLKERLGQDGASAVDLLTFSLKNLPAIVRGAIQKAVVEIAYFFDTLVLDGRSVAQKIKAIFTEDTAAGVEARYAASAKALADAREASLDAITEEIGGHAAAGEAARNRFRIEREEREKTRKDAQKKTTEAAGSKIGGKGASSGPGVGVVNDLALQKQAVDQQIKEQDRLYQAGDIGILAYYEKRKKLSAELAVIEQKEIERKISAADKVDEKNKAVTELELARRRAVFDQADLKAAEAADNEKKLRDAEKLEADILRAQGKAVEARRADLEAQYRDMLDKMKADGDEAGIAIVNKLINTELAAVQIAELQKKIDEAFTKQTLREEDIGRQQEIGATSDFGASTEINASREQTIEQLRTMRAELVLLAEQGVPGAKKAIADLDDRMAKLGATAPTMFKQISVSAIDLLGTAFSDLALGVKSAGDAFKDFARGFAQSIVQMIAKALALQAVLFVLNNIPGGTAVATALGHVKHTGGVIGQGGTIRSVDPSLFLAAPRYHVGGVAGLKPGEVPAILQTGEEVLSRKDPRNVMNGGGQQQGGNGVRILNVVDPSLVSDWAASSSGEETIINILQRNAGSIKQVLA